MDETSQPSFKDWPAWLFYPVRRYPAIFVAFVVMIVLKVVDGTSKGAFDQLTLFATSFLDDGSEDITGILWHTAPLAFSFAVIAFAVFRGWLKFNAVSFAIGAVIISGGARWSDALSTPSQVLVPTHVPTNDHPDVFDNLAIPPADLPPHLTKAISQPIQPIHNLAGLQQSGVSPPVQVLPRIGVWPGPIFESIN